MNDFMAPTATEETFRVDPSYMMLQLQKENRGLSEELTLQRAGFQQLQDANAQIGHELRILKERLEDAERVLAGRAMQLADYELLKDEMRNRGFDPDGLLIDLRGQKAVMIDAEYDPE